MSRHCEHCTFWTGSASGSRAECGNTDVMGTTAHNDTCIHFNAKAWAGNPQIDERGKIVGRVNAGGGLIWTNHQTTVAPGTPIYFDGSGRLTTIPDKGVAPAGIMGSDGKVITSGSTTIPNLSNVTYSYDINIDSHKSFDASEIARHLNEYLKSTMSTNTDDGRLPSMYGSGLSIAMSGPYIKPVMPSDDDWVELKQAFEDTDNV